MSKDTQQQEKGSWLPLIALIVMFVIRWLVYGQGNIPIRFQRCYNMQVRRRLLANKK
jgi:hypothetical protein